VKLSILVTSYGPSPYLRDALDSISVQGEALQDAEVVLLTDRSRGISDLRTPEGSSVPVREVVFPEPSKGRFFSEGIRACRGDYVAFLNDDDLWVPGKLGSFGRIQDPGPPLGLHETGVRFYGADAGGPGGPHRWQRLEGRSGRRFVRPKGGWSNELGRLGLGFNDSRMTLDRRMLLRADPWLEKIEASEDTFFFGVALALSDALFWDPRPLVLYRTHGIPGAPGTDGASPERAREGLRREFSRRIETYRQLELLVRAQAPDRLEVLQFARRGRALFGFLSSLTSSGAGRQQLAREARGFLPFWRVYDPVLNWGLLATAGVSLLSPALARRFLVSVGLGSSRF
jgi:hypothetical protein